MTFSRRQVISSLAGTALLVASGCAVFRSDSELESSLEELEYLLMSIGDDGDDRLVELAGKIGAQARTLTEAHRQFESEFNRLAGDRDVSDAKLSRLVSDYDADRLDQRNELLRSQDELHRAVPTDAWPEVLEVLNRKQRARMPGRAREA